MTDPNKPGQEPEPQDPKPEDTPQDPPADPSTDPKPEGGKDWRDAEIERLRQGEAKYRTQRNETNQQLEGLKDSIAKALGLKEDDPEQVSGKLSDMQSKYRQERVKNAYYRAAFEQGADVDLAWAHLYASGALKDVDPEAEGYEQQVTDALKGALEKNPKLKADYQPQAPNVGGSGSNPANGGGNDPEKNPWSKEHYNLTRQGEIMQQDPVRAKRLSEAANA